MDSGFYTLMTSGASVVCLKNDEYIVPARAVAQLNENKISYVLVVGDAKEAAKKEVGDKGHAAKT